MTKVKITCGDESIILSANFAHASCPLYVDGESNQWQVADARHEADIAVNLVATSVWGRGYTWTYEYVD